MLSPGEQVGDYEIIGLIGDGGMGAVYEARQVSLNRTVALKVIDRRLSSDEAFQQRFRREGEIQAQLDHPNIVPVFQAGEAPEGMFIAMRLIRGTTLKELIGAGDLDDRETVELLEPIADALDAAHADGLIHRDVKPQNILVDEKHHPFLADFGLTKRATSAGLTRTGQFVGTFDYVSPEQVLGEEATVASDVYSLAAVVFECLSGSPPFVRPNDAALLYAHVNEEPPDLRDYRPQLNKATTKACRRGLAKNPEARFESASALVEAVATALDGKSSSLPEPRERRRREPKGTPAAGLQRTTPDSAGSLPEVPQTSPAAAAGPTSRRRRIALAAGTGTLAVAGIVGGLLASGGLGSGEARGSTPAVSEPASVAPPGDWRQVGGVTAEGNLKAELSNSVGLRQAGTRPITIALGSATRGANNLLLNPSLAREIPAASRKPATLDAAGGQLLRYVVPSMGPDRERVVVFALPTTSAVMNLICRQQAGGASSAANSLSDTCWQAAQTLEIQKPATWEKVQPSPQYASSLNRLTETLNTRVSRFASALRAARSSGGQARAARSLAEAYGAAARQAKRLTPPQRARSANSKLAGALTGSSRTYGDLQRAASRKSAGAYRQAQGKVSSSQASLTRAFSSLRLLGYRVKA